MLRFATTLFTAGAFSIASISMGALTISEGFNYADSSALTANGWTAHSGAGSNAIQAKTTSNLTYGTFPSLTGAAGASLGHRSASSEDINRSLGAVTSADGDTIFASFLFRVDDITSTNSATEATVPFMVDGTIWPLRFYVKSDTILSTYTVGIRTHRAGEHSPWNI